MKIDFFKYQATGNDFILLDNRDGKYEILRKEDIWGLCDRRFGIGADGVIMLSRVSGYDFEMKYYNADGSLGSMCGNGGRCIVAFARDRGITKEEYLFVAYDGEHRATIKENNWVELQMNPVNGMSYNNGIAVLDTGSPHYVTFVQKVEEIDVFSKGREIRNSEAYRQKGINVNFVERLQDNLLHVRTYERGVEDETYSCGTGVTAAAIASATDRDGEHNIHIQTKGGMLEVLFKKDGKSFSNIRLAGPAVFVFSGQINLMVK